MTPDERDNLNHLLDRIGKEIVPFLKKGLKKNGLPFSNPGRAKCWEALGCTSTDCHLYGTHGESEQCWQSKRPCCIRKDGNSPMLRFSECWNCKVFQDSCPTVVEQVGEHINSMVCLLNDQEHRIQKDKEHIAAIEKELNLAMEQLRIKEKEIEKIMITDKLTTLFNRQHLITVLEDEIARCQRYSRPVALIMIDIDEFKNFNDYYGHEAGDTMLSFVGSLIKENTRKFDQAFRYGGEEFVVVLPESDLTMAYIVAERIRKGFKNKSFAVTAKNSGNHENLSCTVSVGITATFAYGAEDIGIEELIQQTEGALHRAKEKGGNFCFRFE